MPRWIGGAVPIILVVVEPLGIVVPYKRYYCTSGSRATSIVVPYKLYYCTSGSRATSTVVPYNRYVASCRTGACHAPVDRWCCTHLH